MSKQQPLISVIMSAYNAEKYLSLAIDSILQQTFNNYEFIIVNDGSTDDTETILQKYTSQDSRIVLISRENKGLVASLNEGINLARASLIARMDADDIALPERLQTQFDYMNANPDVLCAGTSIYAIDEDGDELIMLPAVTDSKEVEDLLLAGHCALEHPSVIFRKDEVIRVGNYRQDFEYAEDFDLWLRLSECGKLANLETPLLKYRYLNTSISATKQTLQLERMREACRQAWKRRNDYRQFEQDKPWRPIETKTSKLEQLIQFGWWAFNYKNKKAAVKYAKKAIWLMPYKLDGWRLLIHSLLKLRNNDA